MGLVGRDAQRWQLDDAARLAATGRRLVAALVTGEAGIGKSMLVATALDALDASRWTVLRGEADALERSIPYAALVRVVAPLVHDDEPEIAARADELVRTLDVLGGGAQAEVEASFGHVCGSLTALLRAVAERGPVAVSIDDLDVLDDDTLAALVLAARRLRDVPLALFATSRTAAAAGPTRFGTFVDMLAAQDAVVPIVLGPLDEHDIGLLVGAIIDAAPDEDLVHELHRRTDGNPFFAVEIATSLRDAGQVDRAGRRGARLTSPMRLSRTDAVLRRFAPLDVIDRAVIDTIAVLGRVAPGDVGLIAKVTATPVDRVAAAFDDFVARAILTKSGDGYVFTHDLVRDALYDAIGPARQRLVHAAIADRLNAERAVGKPTDVLLLARHVSASAEPGDAEAAAVLAAAGDLSRGIAPESAASLYARALELAPVHDPARPRLLARRCRALSLASLPAAAADAGRAALAVLPPGDERARTANVVISALVETGALDAALEVADAEVAVAPHSAVLVAQRASVLWNLRRFDDALAEANRADALATSSPAERLLTLGPLGLASACAAVPRPLPEYAAEILRLGARLPPTLELYSAAVASYALATSGFLSLAHTPLARAEVLMEDIGGAAFRAQVLLARVFVDFLEGRWDDAVEAIEHAHGGGADAQLAVQASGLQAIEIEIRSWRGEAVGDDLLARTAPVPNYGDFRAWAVAGHFLGAGRVDDARAKLQETDERNPFEVAYRPLLLARRIDVELAAGDLAAAAVLLGDLDREPQRRWNPWAEAMFLRARAQVEGDAGFAEQSADIAGDEGLVFEQARSQLVAAELQPDAAGGLDAAYRSFQSLGADALRRRAAAVLKARGLKVPRQRSTGSGPLNATELKLARLVQQGLRNREIASVLHLSPRTVEVYLSRIYAKLEVSSRLELARALDANAF